MGKTIPKEVQMTNKYMKKCSTYLAVREMQIKIALRFYPPPHTPKSEWLS
jgi:hypothetical protein